MPTFFLFRTTPLSEEEIARLPMGCFAYTKDSQDYRSHHIVAQAHVRAPLAMMLKMAFDMGAAIPDASFGYEEGFSPSQHSENPEPYSSKEESVLEISEESEEDSIPSVEEAEIIEEESEELQEQKTWDVLLEEGDPEAAMEAFESLGSDRNTQKTLLKINHYFSSKNATNMIFVCQAAIRFRWRTMALKLRVGLRHEDPSVRIATLKAIGALAGPSLSPAVQIMTSDKDEEVKKEAIRTLRKLKRNI